MDSTEHNRECHELRVLGTNGRVFHLKVADVLRLFRSRLFISSIILFTSLIALNDQFLFEEVISLPLRLAYWYLQAALAAALWLGFFVIAMRLKNWLQRDLVVPSAVMITAMVGVLVSANYAGAAILLGRPDLWQQSLLWDVLRYVLIVLVFETMSATFLVPGILGLKGEPESDTQDEPDTGAGLPDPAGAALPSQEPQAGAAQNRISHRGQPIDLERVLYMKSVEHYVELVGHEGTELIRASLRELAGLCPPSQGVRPHRSYWVNRDAIVGLNRADGGQFLVLRNGVEIPVARNRRSEVASWLGRHFGKPDPVPGNQLAGLEKRPGH